ncbi:hypothetical protein H0J13_004560 [Salmonella enterica]|nr:hypothetical protein [Salmonella enterica]
MTAPSRCDNCLSNRVEQTQNDRVYGRAYGTWPEIYYCNDCGAYVGCHEKTLIPLGRMADGKTRVLRVKAHAAFDPLWQSGSMSRTKAYLQLSRKLGIDIKDCHIAMLSDAQLQTVILIYQDNDGADSTDVI